MHFALVEWTGGEDKGKVSIVPTAHIHHFDIDKYANHQDEEDSCYLVEWRSGRSKPIEGWPVFEAVILKVAGE